MKRIVLSAMMLGLLSPQAMAQTITASIAQDVRSTNPGVNRDDTTDGVVLHMVEGLVGYREDGSVGPLLAQSVDMSADGLTYTFKLRTGITFHNGETFSAENVLWNWTRYMDPATEWRCLAEFDGRNGLKVESVTAPDAQTIVMTINQPSAVFLDALARTDCGMAGILHYASVNEDGTWNQPIGTGPYKFGTWKRGEYFELEAFSDYVTPAGSAPDGYVGAKKPLAEKVRFYVISDPETIKAGLLSGTVDLAAVASTDVPEFAANPDFNVADSVDASKHTLSLQVADPLLSKVEMRQAIAAALDLPTLVTQVTNGYGRPNNSAIFPQSMYYSDVQKQALTHDLDKARELLAKAGYKGEPITIIANKRPTTPSFETAVVAQAMLQAAGINATIEVMEWGTQLSRYFSGNYQMMAFSYSSRFDPALSFEQFSGPKDTTSGKVWNNPEALKLIDEGKAVSDPARRQAIFDELHTLLLHDVPMIIYSNGVNDIVSNKRLQGVVSWHSKLRLWEVAKQ